MTGEQLCDRLLDLVDEAEDMRVSEVVSALLATLMAVAKSTGGDELKTLLLTTTAWNRFSSERAQVISPVQRVRGAA